MNKYSFTTGGFWFHLVQISNNTFQDQNGGNWEKKGNQLFSDGGGYIHTIKAEDIMSNKDFSGHIKQMKKFADNDRERFYHDRILFTKGFC
jgi:hypothetical protein